MIRRVTDSPRLRYSLSFLPEDVEEDTKKLEVWIKETFNIRDLSRTVTVIQRNDILFSLFVAHSSKAMDSLLHLEEREYDLKDEGGRTDWYFGDDFPDGLRFRGNLLWSPDTEEVRVLADKFTLLSREKRALPMLYLRDHDALTVKHKALCDKFDAEELSLDEFEKAGEEINKAREELNKKEFEKASELRVQWDPLESAILSCLPDCPSEFPLRLRGSDTRHYALNCDTVWSSSRNLTSEQWKHLIDRKLTHEQQEIDYASSEVNADSADGRRERISEAVRQEVWRRDQGKCARCGSRENLEFDHIIPVSKGGGNTARNLELLCETCNRKKRDHIE